MPNYKEQYDAAQEAYMNNTTYTAPDGKKYEGEKLCLHLESLAALIRRTNGGGIGNTIGSGIDGKNNKATVKKIKM